MKYTDTHAHLGRLSEGVVERLFADGFGRVLDIGTDSEDLAGRMAAFSRYDNVRFAAGIWPSPEAVADRQRKTAMLEKQILAAQESLAAIGECGLDHHQEQPDIAGERELFEAQIDFARKFDLPLIVHSRDAAPETIEILRANKYGRGIIHCYSYGAAEAKMFLDMGFHISFAGNITYKKNEALCEALKFIPDDRLLLETDSPFLSPASHRGTPCEPGFIYETYKKAAAIRETTLEKITILIEENAEKLLFSPISHK